jgi:hypothetical protein
MSKWRLLNPDNDLVYCRPCSWVLKEKEATFSPETSVDFHGPAEPSFPQGELIFSYCCESRSQWPRGLRHELSSPPPTLISWVRIPLEAWMFMCVLCAFILCLPRVEAGSNTSTVLPASRKGRRNGNPVVSGETVPADLRKG